MSSTRNRPRADQAPQNQSKDPASAEPTEESGLAKAVIRLVVVLHMSSSMLAFMSIPDLMIVKACRVNLGFGDKVCSALESRSGGFDTEDAQVQQLVASGMMWRSVLENLFPIALVCLVGAWSDRFGRKMPIVAVLSAFVFQHILLALTASNTTFFGAWSLSIISSLFVSLAGNNACFGMSIFSHVSDTTPKAKLSAATAITGSLFFLGVTVGLGLRGVLASASYSNIFWISATLEFTGLVALIIIVENRPRDRAAYNRLSATEQFAQVFKVDHIKSALGAVVKRRRGNERLMLWLLLLCHALVLSPMFGEGVLTYLFARAQFNMDAAAFSQYVTFKTIVGFVGNFVAMAVLTERLKMSDAGVGIVACGSQFVMALLTAMAPSVFVLYLAPVIGILVGPIMSAPRSIIFKIVPGDETGKINAFIGSLESITPMIVTPLYSLVYAATSASIQGGFFLLTAGLMVPPILIFTWISKSSVKLD